MNVSPAEIERIVRDVLQTLSSSSPLKGTSSGIPASAEDSSLSDKVISVSSFRSLPSTTKTVRILPRAVVTPAARDWCKERGLALVRGETATEPPLHVATLQAASAAGSPTTMSGAKPERQFVSGSVDWLSGLRKQLCPIQTHVEDHQPDDASVIRSLGAAIRRGHATGLAIVASPHSALWQAARDEALRPAIVSQWADLSDILREVPTNVLIVPSQRWNIAGAANVARRFLEHSRSRS